MAYFTFWFPSSFVSRLSEKCQTSLGVWRWSSDAHGWRLDTSSLCCRRWPFWSTEDSDRTWLSDVFNWRLRRHSCACRWDLRPQNVQEVVKWSSQGSHLKTRSKIPGFFLLFFMFVKVTNRLLEKKMVQWKAELLQEYAVCGFCWAGLSLLSTWCWKQLLASLLCSPY